MSDLTDLKQAIEDFGTEEFRNLVCGNSNPKDRARFKEVFGHDFELVVDDRTEGSGDYDGWSWVFKIGDKHFEITGYYSSYEGAEMDSVLDLHEVKQVQKTVTVWEEV